MMREHDFMKEGRSFGIEATMPPVVADYVHRPMINVRLLRHLWSFLAVAEEGNFGRAAVRLGISQPPLTQQIQTLERTLGVRLFDRSRRGAALTPEGLAILPAVQRFAEQVRRLEAAVRAAKDGKSHFVAIGAITSSYYSVLPNVLDTLNREYPQITVSFLEVHTAEVPQMLKAGTIDLAFARLARSSGALKVRPLVIDALVVALPASHRLAEVDSVDLHELVDESWIHVRRQLNPALFDATILACARAGFTPRFDHEVGSEASQVAFVSCGLGIALLPRGQSLAGAPNVIFRPLKERVEIVTASVAWDDERITAAARTVLEIALTIGTSRPNAA